MDTLYLVISALPILVFLLFVQYYKQRWPVRNFPPGPYGYPFVGSVFDIKTPMQIWLWDLAKKYGDVCSLPIGSKGPTVVITGWPAMKEAMVTKATDFASRREGVYSVTVLNPGPRPKGIFDGSYTPEWQRQRLFAHTTLRGFGFGKASFEGKIMEEVEILLAELTEQQDNPLNLTTLMSICTANFLCDIIFGTHFDQKDPKAQVLRHTIDKCLKTLVSDETLLMDAVPLSRPFLQKHVQFMKSTEGILMQYFSKEFNEHIATFQAESSPRDFIDSYLAKMREDPDGFTLEELPFVLRDLFVAGLTTTSATLMFSVLYMTVYPGVQEKVHQELMKVVGPDRLPRLQDREQLPYTLAVIRESQRMACIAPIIVRCTTTDTSVGGYDIPKGTNVICNAWSVDYSPELWCDPEKFDPNRHLNDDGQLVKKPLMSFGAGRRACMGASLVKMQMFLFFSCMMHRFKFEIPAGAEKPSLVGDCDFTRNPKPFEVVFTQFI